MTEESKEQLRKMLNEFYVLGWNAGLDMAAFKLKHEFQDAFGKDTLDSISIYLTQLKNDKEKNT